MNGTKKVNGVSVDLSDDEQAEYDARNLLYNSLANRKSRATKQIYETKNNYLAGLFTFSNGMIGHIMTGLVLLGKAKGNKKAVRKFAALNGNYLIAGADVDGFDAEIDDYAQGFENHAFDLRKLVDDAVTDTDLDAIDLVDGWPVQS